MAKETPDELTARLLNSMPDLDLSGFGGDDTSESEAEATGPVQVTHIPDFVWGVYTGEQMSILRASGFTSAMILVGSREGDTVVARTGYHVRPNGSSVSDAEILETVRVINTQCFDREDGMEVVGALIAQRRSPADIQTLMTQIPSLQVVMAGYPTNVQITATGVTQDLAILPYTLSSNGGIQFMPKFFVDRT